MPNLSVFVWTTIQTPFAVARTKAYVAGYVETDPAEIVDLGMDFHAWKLVAPNGKIKYAETVSGGIVASEDDLAQLKVSVFDAGKDFLEKQVLEQRAIGRNLKPVAEAEFWKALRLT
jgi:hypothetical protein